MTDSWKRLSVSIRQMSAGNMVYGLYRVPLLARAGVYRRVLVPDRLLMTELAVYGQFKQVPQVLWFRRWYGRIFSLNRQRKSFFPQGRPLYMWAPWWMSHGVSLFWTFGVEQQGLPAVSELPAWSSARSISSRAACSMSGSSCVRCVSICSNASVACGPTSASCAWPRVSSSARVS